LGDVPPTKITGEISDLNKNSVTLRRATANQRFHGCENRYRKKTPVQKQEERPKPLF
jgi:hypothetical protein